MTLLQFRKRTMTLAGVILAAYLVLHMLINLSFFSPARFEQVYAVYNLPWIRWPLLTLVLASLFIHVQAAVVIRVKNHQARRIGYRKYDKLQIPATLVSLSIVLLLLFILVHIIQGVMLDTSQLHQAVQNWFRSDGMLMFYLVGMLILALHLQHSLPNIPQTLGMSADTHQRWTRCGVVLLTTGFVSVPLYVWITS